LTHTAWPLLLILRRLLRDGDCKRTQESGEKNEREGESRSLSGSRSFWSCRVFSHDSKLPEKCWGKYSRKRAAGESARPRNLKGAKTMPVIGRMDDQVEEVLIAPIARRHEQKRKEREQENQAQREEATGTEEEVEQPGSSE
jgi:hypothetical protein